VAFADAYDVGETVVLRATFLDEDGALTTPDTTTLYIQRPDGSVDTVENASLSTPSVGVKTYADTCEARGITWYRFKGVSGGSTVIEQGYYWGRRQQAVPA
jgi:hypothetical protein